MGKLRIQYLQHVPHEGLGTIKEWTLSHGHSLTSTLLYENQVFPKLSDFDFLIIMGGPMSANDDAKFPWLSDEKRLIQEAIRSDKLVLGICLGSQLVSAALGVKVYKNKENEIGWFDIEFTGEAMSGNIFSGFGNRLKVFHWHGDTFDLPEGAILLASSAATPNQAYIYNEKVLALQFHLETESTEEMIEGGDLGKPARYVQTKEEILSYDHLLGSNKKVFFELLDRLVKEKI